MMPAGFGLISTWAHWYGDSAALSTAVTAVHLAGMLLGGGLALASDRTTLRALARHEPLTGHLAELDQVHRPIAVGLALTFLTGFLMLAADLDAMVRSPVFWTKMGVLVALLANGWRIRQTARCLAAGVVDSVLWRTRLKATVIASLTLWFLALGLGAALPAF